MLDENIYVHPPLGFEVKGQGHKVYKLNKTMYDLNQFLRALNDIIDHYLLKDGFNNNNKPTLYIEGNQHGNIHILCLSVHAMTYTRNMLLHEFK